MKNTYSVEIDAPPEHVFYWLDGSDRAIEWVPNLVENEELEVTDGRVGSRTRSVFLEHGQRMEMISEVTVYEPSRRIEAELTGDMFDLTVDYQLEDLGGRTRVTQYSEARFKGFFMKLLSPIMLFMSKKSSMKQLEDSFAKLAELAESRKQEADT